MHQEDPYSDMPELELSSEEEEEKSDDEIFFFCNPPGIRKKFKKETEFLDTFESQEVTLEPKNIQEALQSETKSTGKKQ